MISTDLRPTMDGRTTPKSWAMHARLTSDTTGKGGREGSQSREQLMNDLQ